MVKPYNWVSWRDARYRMREIWSGWQSIPDHANRAMVNALRRGNVPIRGEARDLKFQPVALKDVAAGLLSVTSDLAEYQVTAFNSGFLRLGHFEYPPMPVASEKTAVLFGAELAWEQFRADLTLFELPAGVTPDTAGHDNASEIAASELRPAPPAKIDEAIREEYDEAEAGGNRPPNVNEVIGPVQAKLRAAGLEASGKQIRERAGATQHKKRRLKPGQHWRAKST